MWLKKSLKSDSVNLGPDLNPVNPGPDPQPLSKPLIYLWASTNNHSAILPRSYTPSILNKSTD